MNAPLSWQPPRVLAPLLGGAILAITFWWNPDGWMNPLVDYGRELYVPWRLTAGEVLYRDIAYFNGPFSPYFNALWFALAGVNLHVLTVVNAALVALSAALIHQIAVRIADRFAALVATVMFLTVFAFQHVETIGNYNWLAPYSHEITHGVALCLLTTYCGIRHTQAAGRRWLLATGATLGVTFLTKPEIFLAALAAALTAVLARGFLTRPPGSGYPLATAGRQTVTLVGIAAVPVACSAMALMLAMPAGTALRGVCGGWLYVTNTELTSLPFYLRTRGTLDIGASVTSLLMWSGIYLVILAACIGATIPGRAPRPWLAGAIAGLAMLGAEWLVGLPLETAFQPLSICCLIIGIGLARGSIRDQRARCAGGLVLAVVAASLLLKIYLNVAIVHYGFALTVPVFVLSTLALTCWLPETIASRGWHAARLRWAATAILVVVAGKVVATSGTNYADKTTLTAPHESIRCRATRYAELVGVSVQWIHKNVKPDESVLVLPEGISINYLTRRRNPTGHINFMPPEMVMFGEPRILADVRAHPPDVVLLAHRSTKEYGLPLFGTHYAKELVAWVYREYRPVMKFEATPPNTVDTPLGGLWIFRKR